VVGIIGGLLVIAALFFVVKAVRRVMGYSLARRKEAVAGVMFVSPWLVGFLFLTAGPMFLSVVFSFCEYDVLHPARFIGLDNFMRMFGFHKLAEGGRIVPNDPFFWKSLWNTFYITVFGVPLSMIIGLAIAMLLNAEIRGIAVYRTLYYLPSIVPIVATAILWLWLLNPQIGGVSIILREFNVASPNWWGDANWAKPALILMLLWASGSSMVIWLAGLKGIPNELYEAAEIDGSNAWHRFWKITIPMLTPYIFFNLIIGTIGYLQIFTQAFVVSEPPTAGPVDSLLFYVYYLFNNAFSYFKMGYACALAWVLFVIIFILTMLQLKIAPRWVYYEAETER
jgi:multiple sugar transport system permease protein